MFEERFVENRLPCSVQWYEGMLLLPQHFQRADYRLQYLFGSFCSFFSPFCYGVNLLSIDTAAIAASTLRVLRASGVFQDGLMFDHDSETDEDLSRNLSEILSKTFEPFFIYLAVAKHKEGHDLLTGVRPRYTSNMVAGLTDENSGSNGADIPVLRPKLKLLLREEIDAGYIAFPLILVRKSETDGIDITEYVPPMLSLGVHSKLLEIIRDLVSVLRNKISFFSDRQGNASFILGEEIKSNLKILIQATLELEAISKTYELPPFEYYKVLLKSASMLASINPEQTIPSLPVYNHDELLDTFKKICDFCKKSIEYLQQPFVTMPFAKTADGIFKLVIKKEWLNQDEFIISVKRKFAASDNDLLDWIDGARIASNSSVSIVKDRRVLGAERRIIERGEKIVPPAGALLLAIKSSSPYINAAEELYIFNQSKKAVLPEEITLYVDK